MLSYLHAYHAGCLADVHKHGLLSILLQKLTEKPRPITYMETHAGRGVYDLDSEESLKTSEADKGILSLERKGVLPSDHPYTKALKHTKDRYGLHAYPGSPAIARSLLRPTDHLHLMELHPQESRHLKRNFREDNCHCHHRDGYEGVLGISPPKARRGLVLIDPSFEIKTEYDQCVKFIKALHKKWPEAVIALWYPMLSSDLHVPMMQSLEAEHYKNAHHRTWTFKPLISKDQHKGMKGTGLFIVNCPWGVERNFDAFEAHLVEGISDH